MMVGGCLVGGAQATVQLKAIATAHLRAHPDDNNQDLFPLAGAASISTNPQMIRPGAVAMAALAGRVLTSCLNLGEQDGWRSASVRQKKRSPRIGPLSPVAR
jgi:hypothetical protein